jgi:hypothetical protein
MDKNEVNELIEKQLKKYETKINALGCPTKIGCMAGKAHFQMHEDKLASDVNNFKNYIKSNDEDKRVSSLKLSEVTIMLHDVVANLANLLESYKEVKKTVQMVGNRLWAIVTIILGLCIGTVWQMNRTSKAVESVNKTDVENQTATETYMVLMLEQLSKKPIKNLLAEHEEGLAEVEKHKLKEHK